jgi:hypothetical protein
MGALILALAGCAPKQTTPPNPTDENGAGGNNLSLPGTDIPQSPLADPESVETPTLAPEDETPTAAEHSQPAAIPVESPSAGSLEFIGAPYSVEFSPSEITDLNAADAVYAYFLSIGRRWTPSTDEAFIAGMSEWAKELEKLDIHVVRAANSYGVATMLVKGDGNNQQVLLDFMNDSGALRSATPGGWSPESTSKWINVKGRAGLVVGPDGVGYVTQMDENGTDVVGYLNPYGASLDNVHTHWIPVEDGMPAESWNGTEWVKVETKNWRDLIEPVDLSPESALVTKLNKLNLPSVVVKSDPLGSIEKYRGLITEFQIATYIHNIVVVKKDGVSQIVVVGVDNYGGVYKQVEFIGAIDRGNKGGVSIPIMMGNDFDASFRFADRNLDFPKLNDFDNVLAYYESRIGTQLTIARPEWTSSEPFDPAVFALAFSIAPSKSGLSPSGYPLYDGFYQYVVANCLSAESCNPGGISSEEFPTFPKTVLESD